MTRNPCRAMFPLNQKKREESRLSWHNDGMNTSYAVQTGFSQAEEKASIRAQVDGTLEELSKQHPLFMTPQFTVGRHRLREAEALAWWNSTLRRKP